jgi:subtilisin family serine protease
MQMVILYSLMSLAWSQQPVVQGEYLIKVKPSAVGGLNSKLQGKAFLKAAFDSPGAFHLQNVDSQFAQQLKADPEIEYIEPNYVLQSIQPVVNMQQVDAMTAKYYDQTGSAVRATEAWAISRPYDASNRPIVAIIDTGLDKTHYVFSNTNSLWINPVEIAGNSIDDDFNGYVDDVNGWNFITNTANFADDQNHGTHVAGIVLGATQDILATAGTLEPAKIRLMPLKFLDAQGAGSTSAAISAIYYAVNMGAKVINCSWGGGAYSKSLHDALIYAYDRGVLVVSAAGNYSSNNDVAPVYPANYDVPSNISIAASSDTDRVASFSNYGVSTVNLAAPGLYVFSTIRGGYFSSMSGTSMAAPFVAGTAALALREAPQLSGYQLRQIAMQSAQSISFLSGYVSSGARIESRAMLQNAMGLLSALAFQPVYKPNYDRSPASESSSSKGGGGCGLVTSVLAAGAGPGTSGMSGLLAILFGFPLVCWFVLRRKTATTYARKHERYMMESQIVVKAGGRELVGTMKTISMGGLSFNVEEALEKGGSVTMMIKGPGGQESLEVEGRIVWSEKNAAYGVQFDEVQQTVRETLFGWTKNLIRQN